MLDEVVADLRVVPAAEDGGLGASVVLVHKLSVFLLLKRGGLGLAATISSTLGKCNIPDLHDAFGNQPFTHLALGPPGVRSVLSIVVVALHQAQELVAGGMLRVNNAVLDKPFVQVGGRPSVVDRVSCLGVGNSDVVE